MPTPFAQYLKSDFGINLPHYRSPEYDRPAHRRRGGEKDAGKRRELLQHAESVALQDHPLIPLYFLREQAPREATSAGLVRQRG
ncbi:MAG: hypothetical protein WDO56_32915 [Gammaproteobacteria bacterium]